MSRASTIGAQVWSLIALGVGLNLLLGALVALFKIPLYLDSLGTVLVASLAGPAAGAITGVCGVALLGLTSPTALAFFPVAALVGLLAGVWARFRAFGRPWLAAIGGAVTGVCGAAAAAPIATYFFGGVTGGGTDLLVAIFRAGGANALLASFWQGLAVDPLDKAVTFVSVAVLLRTLPARALRCYPLGRYLTSRSGGAHAYKAIAVSTTRDLAPSQNSAPQPSSANDLPAAEAGLKLMTLSVILLAAMLWPAARALEALWLLLGVLTAHLVVAPRLSVKLLSRLALALLPLGLSLAIISGLMAQREGDVRSTWLGLSWSLPGLTESLFFLTRAGLMLWALSVFFATTPLPRLGELLIRLRVPYTVVFVVLTGADLARQLRIRWNAIEEAQQSRGLCTRPDGLWASWRAFMGVLAPTLSSFFSELPIRASALQSRGLLNATPCARIPNSWLGEAEPTWHGRLFTISIALLTVAGYLCL